MDLKIISAGAGSGKTYRLTQEMVQLLKGGVRASGIIATTFTNKAAAELQERVRVKLLEEGLTDSANELTNALIGTVHSLGVKLLRRFAFEAGVSPEVDIIADEDQQMLFNLSLANILNAERVAMMEELRDRLGLNKNDYYDWRQEVKYLTDTARANDFSIEVLEESKIESFKSFQAFLGKPSAKTSEEFSQKIQVLLEETVERLENNEDQTKVTNVANTTLVQFLERLRRGQELSWHEWVKISKIKVGAKSRDDVADLVDFAKSHDSHPQFHQDIQTFIYGIFDIAIKALEEYDQYKKERGLIDYIDMEIQVKRLLDQESVISILKEELDLLMVDEFQDTNPIQLEIFLKLSAIAKHSVWVGDPKQSIYGFRGADPRLMQAIIESNGGIRPEDIQEYSWRSREDIVYATNALFTKAFPHLPVEQVALKPKRKKVVDKDSKNKENEPMKLEDALIHWHFQYDGEGRRLPGKPWMENCIASAIQRFLNTEHFVFCKDEDRYRKIRPGDIAILCRSNIACTQMAEALHRSGLKAAISRAGLLKTAEAKLILACLKFILNPKDSLSAAEILLLASGENIESIIDDRLHFLDQLEHKREEVRWAEKNKYIAHLNSLRPEVAELSSAELLNLVMEELDLRRIIASWGKVDQRFDNVDVIRKMALQYEEACNRLHSAASLGGFLLWINAQAANEQDKQGSGEGKDAVNVLTYHKSKGLEWPMVICHSLEGKLRDRVWGVDIVPKTEEVDLKNLLGNRWLRYWINPYAMQISNTLLEERLNASEAKSRANQMARAEEGRLLYVGITRARDYLVFPTRPKETLWLNRIWHEGKEKQQTLDPEHSETPWEWNNKVLHATTTIMPFPRDFTYAERQAENLNYLEPPHGKGSWSKYFIDVEQQETQKAFKVIKEKRETYGTPLFFDPAEANAYQIAKATKAFLTADHPQRDYTQREQMLLGICERYEIIDDIDPRQIQKLADNYFGFIDSFFTPKQILRKYPIQFLDGDQLFNTTIDTIIETQNGEFIILQNSSFKGKTTKQYIKKAHDLRAWLHLSNQAVQTLFKSSSVRTCVHFVMDASIIELQTQKLGMQANLF